MHFVKVVAFLLMIKIHPKNPFIYPNLKKKRKLKWIRPLKAFIFTITGGLFFIISQLYICNNNS